MANFAYDPINYTFIKELKVVDIFLDVLASNDEDFLEHAIAGLTNLSAGKFRFTSTKLNQMIRVFFRCNQQRCYSEP